MNTWQFCIYLRTSASIELLIEHPVLDNYLYEKFRMDNLTAAALYKIKSCKFSPWRNYYKWSGKGG